MTSDQEGNRRAALAEWITDPRNALAWRSIVNRVWHYHFGRGLVKTHLTILAAWVVRPVIPSCWIGWRLGFLENGGSFKKLHRLIVTSSVYL